MHITDPIADLLTRIRNASSAKHPSVDIPASNMKRAICKILMDEGYVRSMQVIEDNLCSEKSNSTKKYHYAGYPGPKAHLQARPAHLHQLRGLPQGHEGPWHSGALDLARRHDR